MRFFFLTLTFTSLLLFQILPQGQAQAWIRTDGRFWDWDGQAFLSDPYGDSDQNHDIRYLYWATNEGVSYIYYMAERHSPANTYQAVTYRLNIDVNNNSIYSDAVDRYATISYTPSRNKGTVYVRIYTSGGALISANSGDWGNSAREGASKCEFGLSMSNLGISPGQAIRFYLTSNGTPYDQLPNSGDIQWSPVPAAGKVGLFIIFVAGIIMIIRSVRLKKSC